MRNLFLDLKIKRELKKFVAFKNSYNFNMKEIEKRDDGAVFCDGACLRENADAEWVGETESLVNVGYIIHGANHSKVLSNLFPYKFYFKGHKMACAESVFQAFKFKDKKLQKFVFEYSALNANRVKGCSDYDWKESGKVYFLGKEYDRYSKEYELLLDEMYVSMLQNPLFVQALKNVGDKYILHAMGEEDRNKTTFSREEFEKELNILKAYVVSKHR